MHTHPCVQLIVFFDVCLILDYIMIDPIKNDWQRNEGLYFSVGNPVPVFVDAKQSPHHYLPTSPSVEVYHIKLL